MRSSLPAPGHHPIGLVGTIDDDMTSIPNTALRERVGTYAQSRFPNYPIANADGYPPRVDVSRRIAMFSAGFPDHYETFRPKLDAPNEPTTAGKDPNTFIANERYKSSPGAMLRSGNLPTAQESDVHSGEDVILTAVGPGSDRVRGQLDNTEVFRIIVEAFGLGARGKTGED
jgi:alkaline phosphatase